jgi:DNA-binding CsgD family transcriptional regulator
LISSILPIYRDRGDPGRRDLISQELSNLTDREREVLRLLANGHDIKSIARELSISTSAVTDRLRHARRKLGVSTSREAARIFANSESGPRFDVHRFSGEANPADPMQQKPSRRLFGMGIAMMILIAAAVTYFSVIDLRSPGQSRDRAQSALHSNAAAGLPAGLRPIKVVVAENPRKYCQGHAPPHAQSGSGFTLQCAGHDPHALPLKTLRRSEAPAPPSHGPNAGPRPTPHTAARPAR